MQWKLLVVCFTMLAGALGLHLSSKTAHTLQGKDHQFLPILVEGIVAVGEAIFSGLTAGQAVAATATATEAVATVAVAGQAVAGATAAGQTVIATTAEQAVAATATEAMAGVAAGQAVAGATVAAQTVAETTAAGQTVIATAGQAVAETTAVEGAATGSAAAGSVDGATTTAEFIQTGESAGTLVDGATKVSSLDQIISEDVVVVGGGLLLNGLMGGKKGLKASVKRATKQIVELGLSRLLAGEDSKIVEKVDQGVGITKDDCANLQLACLTAIKDEEIVIMLPKCNTLGKWCISEIKSK